VRTAAACSTTARQAIGNNTLENACDSSERAFQAPQRPRARSGDVLAVSNAVLNGIRRKALSAPSFDRYCSNSKTNTQTMAFMARPFASRLWCVPFAGYPSRACRQSFRNALLLCA
jgi:hypothetical protein